MRVISGKYKGKSLEPTPEGSGSRPTLGRVKESLFSILHFGIEGSRCLDIFAGSGALGIEMLSRGAKEVVFIDNNTSRIISRNLANCKAEARILSQDYAVSLQRLKGECFDIVMMDPPYNWEAYPLLFELLLKNKLVHEDTIISYEHSLRVNVDTPVGFEKYDSRKYGKTIIDFFRLAKSCDGEEQDENDNLN